MVMLEALLAAHLSATAPPDFTLCSCTLKLSVVGCCTLTMTFGEYAWPPVGAGPVAETENLVLAASGPLW